MVQPFLIAGVLAAAVVAPTRALPAAFEVPPILMYHRIDPQRPTDAGGRVLTVSPQAFASEITSLRRDGIAMISMADLANDIELHKTVRRTVVLTFDDGYADQARYALPVLRREGARATFYIVTGTVGIPNHLTWSQLALLRKDGMDLGGHGRTHADLSHMSAARQAAQIFGCLAILRAKTGERVTSYAFPSGGFNAATLRLLRASGLTLAVTTDASRVIPPQNRFELTRTRVIGGWDLAAFQRAVRRALARTRRIVRVRTQR